MNELTRTKTSDSKLCSEISAPCHGCDLTQIRSDLVNPEVQLKRAKFRGLNFLASADQRLLLDHARHGDRSLLVQTA